MGLDQGTPVGPSRLAVVRPDDVVVMKTYGVGDFAGHRIQSDFDTHRSQSAHGGGVEFGDACRRSGTLLYLPSVSRIASSPPIKSSSSENPLCPAGISPVVRPLTETYNGTCQP